MVHNYTMDNYHLLYQGKQLGIRIPATILSHTELSLNQKLILGLDYTFSKKMGFTSMSNKDVSDLIELHPNIISYCRKQLTNKGFINKQGRIYSITEKHQEFKVDDNREVIIPCEVYRNSNIITGAKLLWGEYNSISKGHKEYFAKRLYTAKRLNASEESVTNWTKQLRDNYLLSAYFLKKGFCQRQKIIITSTFD